MMRSVALRAAALGWLASSSLAVAWWAPTRHGSDARVAVPLAAVDRTKVSPVTPLDPNRVRPDQAAAIARLGAVASLDVPVDGQGHVHDAPVSNVALDAPTRARLDAQLATARSAALALSTLDAALAAGYQVAASPDAGIGTHLVKWSLVDRAFDPAQPSMLLFDERPGQVPHIVGLSYWVRSATAPDGFAGPNDLWHQHSGLCVVNGWIDREKSEPPPECQGTWLGGSDLWMLHVWVVPGWDNRRGVFANWNPKLCPADAGTPDINRCVVPDIG